METKPKPTLYVAPPAEGPDMTLTVPRLKWSRSMSLWLRRQAARLHGAEPIVAELDLSDEDDPLVGLYEDSLDGMGDVFWWPASALEVHGVAEWVL